MRTFDWKYQSPVAEPPLRFLHSESSLSSVKLDLFRRWSTQSLIASLAPGQPSALQTHADGTVMEGHHRLFVLREQGIDIDALPRELLRRESGD